jgi:hypothetical protein
VIPPPYAHRDATGPSRHLNSRLETGTRDWRPVDDSSRSHDERLAQHHPHRVGRLRFVGQLLPRPVTPVREGVITHDIYDATLNPLYHDVLKHYGAVALPCRVRDPDRKGKVESGVGHAQKTITRVRGNPRKDGAKSLTSTGPKVAGASQTVGVRK